MYTKGIKHIQHTLLTDSTPAFRPSIRMMLELFSDSEILIITPVSFLTRFTKKKINLQLIISQLMSQTQY